MDALVAVLQSPNVDEVTVQKMTLAKFTPTDATQAKFLRILKTIDYIYTKKKMVSGLLSKADRTGRAPAVRRGEQWRSAQSPTPSEVASIIAFSTKRFVQGSDIALNESKKAVQDETVVNQFNKASFSELWRRLIFVLNHVQQHSTLLFVATVLLPLIECASVTFEKLTNNRFDDCMQVRNGAKGRKQTHVGSHVGSRSALCRVDCRTRAIWRRVVLFVHGKTSENVKHVGAHESQTAARIILALGAQPKGARIRQ
jgi:hypothetical protein